MKIQLDIQLNKKLRDAVNKIINFSINKTSTFQFPSHKKGVKRKDSAFNCICAALDRIDDLVEHCNALELTQSKEGTFALCDLFNYGQTLIDCITIIGNIYHVKYDSTNDTSSFHKKGISGTGNDEKYFKYLRSLCSVHPLATNAHSEYQGEQPEWCPYINIANSLAMRSFSCNDKSLNKAEYFATVYRNDTEFSKHIPIEIKQVFHYIKKRYAFINEIIEAINDYNDAQIKKLKEQPILTPSECDSYDDYLKNLEKEIHNRCGNSEYEARTWRAIFRTHFADSKTEELLNKFKTEMQHGIKRIHIGLQNMDCLNLDWSFDAINASYLKELKDYHYEDEKMIYLVPCYALEDRDNEDFSFIDEAIGFDALRMQIMLDMISNARNNGATHQDLQDIGRYIDANYKTTNTEWARIQLKIMEPILGDNITFNYFLNDWHLHLQVELSKWLLSKSKEQQK